PVIVKFPAPMNCPRPSHRVAGVSDASISPFPATVHTTGDQVVCRHARLDWSSNAMYLSVTIPRPGTAAVVEIAKHSVAAAVPAGQVAAQSLTAKVAFRASSPYAPVADARRRAAAPRRTVTVKLAVAAFPLRSTAEHVTLVRPILNRLPDLGSHVTGTTPSTSSFAVGVKRTMAPFAPPRGLTTTFLAPSTTGALTSNARPGTAKLPSHVSVAIPFAYPASWATVVIRPLPVAPA